MQIDQEAISKQIDEEFGKAYEKFLDIYFPLDVHQAYVKLIRKLIPTHIKFMLEYFYTVGYKEGFSTRQLYGFLR